MNNEGNTLLVNSAEPNYSSVDMGFNVDGLDVVEVRGGACLMRHCEVEKLLYIFRGSRYVPTIDLN